jgi:hypothetical protein
LTRNFVRRPSIFNNDIAIFKNIKLGEDREIQLRWEVYNIFNHTNFSDIFSALSFAPDGAVTALAAGASLPGRDCSSLCRRRRQSGALRIDELGSCLSDRCYFWRPQCGQIAARHAGLDQN